ncbi:uncharacterized protein LOC131169340 [Hevea brasiliensis]|uniref:uncharacterized protein LOC131169340 n=1 Tax=Hevea brasiliensis TaxID=3981 RepID=UPI00260023B0|nr:uncharacterized protein LOC131169340 [Hevea brasiliensis]
MIQQLTSRIDQLAAHNRMLENQIAQQASSSSKTQGKLLSEPENPREHCKIVILRSGKIMGEGKKDEVEEEKNKEDEDKNEYTSNHDEVNEEANKKKEVEKEEEEKYVPPPPYKLPLPYPQRFQKAKLDKRLEDYETVALTEECSALLQNKLPPKLKDLGSLSIPCHIRDTSIDKALCDLGVSVSLMPLSICAKLKVGELKPITIFLQLADRSIKYPVGILENVPLKVGKFFIPVDFVVLKMEEDIHIPIILGRPFLAIAGAIIDVKNGRLTLKVREEELAHKIRLLTGHITFENAKVGRASVGFYVG